MYAIIRTGGKQYKVSVGDVIEVERLPQEEGSEISFEDVLMVGSDDQFSVGQPVLDKTKVVGEIVDQFRGKKIIVFKHKRRKDYRKKMGHRQELSRVRIKDIVSN
jgi:large subunit ribosomal protein L21